MLGVIVAHGLLATWLLMGSVQSVSSRQTRGLSLFAATSSEAPQTAPTKVALPSELPDDRVLAELPPSPSSADSSTAGDVIGADCLVANSLNSALVADDAAMGELAALPPGVRSDADAVTLWSGAWIDVAHLSPIAAHARIDGLKRVIVATVAALPKKCQDAETTGPQIIAIPERGRTTMLVIGSGVWRWSDLLDRSAEDGSTGTTTQPKAEWLAPLGFSGN